MYRHHLYKSRALNKFYSSSKRISDARRGNTICSLQPQFVWYADLKSSGG